jgi:hypothetical protein
MVGRRSRLTGRAAAGAALACLLMSASASASTPSKLFKGEVEGCKYAVTIEAEEASSSGAYAATFEECASGEVEYTLQGTFSENSALLGAVKATAKLSGHQVAIEETLGTSVDVGFDLARAIETAGESEAERTANRKQAREASERLVVLAAKQLVEIASARIRAESPAPPSEPPPPTSTGTPPPSGAATLTPGSAGRLSTVAIQRLGTFMSAAFLCQVSMCRVSIAGVIVLGKRTFKLQSLPVGIAEGRKERLLIRVPRKDHKLLAAALARHVHVKVTLSATIDSTIGRQVVRALSFSLHA